MSCLPQQLVEGATLVALRMEYGDEAVCAAFNEMLSDEQLAELAERHPNQIASMMENTNA